MKILNLLKRHKPPGFWAIGRIGVCRGCGTTVKVTRWDVRDQDPYDQPTGFGLQCPNGCFSSGGGIYISKDGLRDSTFAGGGADGESDDDRKKLNAGRKA